MYAYHLKLIWYAHPLSVPNVQCQNLYTSACNWHKMLQALHKCVSLYVLHITVHRLKPGYLPLTYLFSPWRWSFGLTGGRVATTELWLTVSVYSDGYTVTYSQFVQGQKCNIRQNIHFFYWPKILLLWAAFMAIKKLTLPTPQIFTRISKHWTAKISNFAVFPFTNVSPFLPYGIIQRLKWQTAKCTSGQKWLTWKRQRGVSQVQNTAYCRWQGYN